MFHSHSTQIGRCQVSRFVKKNSQCCRSPIDRSNKRHGISLNGGRVLTVMTRAVPVHRGWLGSFPVRAHASGLKGLWLCFVKALSFRPGKGQGSRAVPSERKKYLGGRKKAVSQGLKPSLEPVRCGTAKAVPFVQPDRIKQRITAAQQASRGCLMTLRIETTHYSRLRNTRNR
jgi:hypothetical protein